MMADQDVSESTRSSASSRTPGTLVEKGRTRPTSPSTLPSELVFKARTQVGRFESLQALKSQLPTQAHTTSLDEVQLFAAHVEDLHLAFPKEYAHFEVTWPVKCINHEYFASNLAVQESQMALSIKIQLNRLREDVTAMKQSRYVATVAAPSRCSKLPEIALPTFSGSYKEWPAYSDLFQSLIINDEQLMEIDRLHYLRSDLSGEPSRLVNSYPLTGASFQACWEELGKKYSNKRVLIEEQLDKLLNLAPIATRSAKTLNDLVSSINELHKSFTALGATADMYNCLLVHHATSCLDKNTREAWETSVGTTNDYPRFLRFKSSSKTHNGDTFQGHQIQLIALLEA